MPLSPKPLDSFALLRSSNVEEVCAALASVFTRPVLAPLGRPEGFAARMNDCRLSDVGLAFASFGCDVRFEFPPSGIFSLVYTVRGSGEIACGAASVGLAPGSSVMVPSDCAQRATFSANNEHLALRISARALTKKLEALTGAAVNGPLHMRPLQNAAHPAAQMLEYFLPLFADMLSGPGPPCPRHCIAEAEDVLMTLFLCGHRHNYSHLLERPPPNAEPWLVVRRAEDYIEANVQQAVTLEDLANVAGVSAFTLFRAFKKYRGYSPREFLAHMRALRPQP